jgi:hypothetical protein
LSATLLSIVAHARSGALDHAWRLFDQAGLGAITDDPAVLSVRGRLLKDRALASSGAERRRWWLEAAEAYGLAGALNGATYPLINAATLSLLAGRRDEAGRLAQLVLDRLARGEGEPDTPYWQGATRAEALLLLGDVAAAKAALTKAMARAPRAWEDHASTLRQFGLILEQSGEEAGWLDPLRPPRSLHFAGHMGLADQAPSVRAEVEAFLEAERIGFAFGALAAGADILIAEALLARGAELHLTLPAPIEAFRQASVSRSGAPWAERFDAVLARADTVRAIDQGSPADHPLAVRLAAEVAMGCAVMQAQTLMSEAVQLLILDRREPETGPEMGGSAWIGDTWRHAGRRQQVLIAPRARGRAGREPVVAEGPAMLTAMLCVDLSGVGDLDRLIDQATPALARAIDAGPVPLGLPRWAGEAVCLAYASPTEASEAALGILEALASTGAVRIGGAYGLARRAHDPFGGAPLWLGPAARLPGQVAASVPPGAVHVTEDFAAALHAARPNGHPRTEYVGDLPPDDVADEIRLFSLKR